MDILIISYPSKHDLRPILTCRTPNSTTQEPPHPQQCTSCFLDGHNLQLQAQLYSQKAEIESLKRVVDAQNEVLQGSSTIAAEVAEKSKELENAVQRLASILALEPANLIESLN